MTDRANTRAFTLLEVLVSVALLAVMALSVTQSLSSSFRMVEQTEARNERFHEARQVMRRITRDLRMAFLRAQPPEEVREEDPAVLTRFLGEEDELYFVTSSHVRLRAEGRESDQAEVAYFLRRPKYDTPYRSPTLFRRESRRVDHRPDRGGVTWPVVDGVKTFKVEYWDDAKEIGDDAWQRSWDSDDKELLPARVRVTLELEQEGMRRVVRFVGQAAPKIRRPIQPIVEYKR
jgi:type II secretion system protein J